MFFIHLSSPEDGASSEDGYVIAIAYEVRDGARIVIFAPESFSFSFYDPSQGWEPELQGTLTHEYTHLVNNASFTPIARMTVEPWPRPWRRAGSAPVRGCRR